jgi:hypothetical protein
MKRYLACVFAALCALVSPALIAATPCDPVKNAGNTFSCQMLASGVTTAGQQPGINVAGGRKTFGVFITTTSGAGAASVVVQGTVNGITWQDVWTVSISNAAGSEGGDSATDTSSSYYQYRLVVNTISGTGATVYAMVLR